MIFNQILNGSFAVLLSIESELTKKKCSAATVELLSGRISALLFS